MDLNLSLGLILALLLSQCSAIIYFLDKNGNYTLSLDDDASGFGPGMSGDVEGYLALAEPLNACAPLKPPKNRSFNYIALAQRGNCSFVEKVINAQEHYVALIVYDDRDEPIIPMEGDTDDVTIPSVFISLASGKLIFSQHAIGNYTIIKPNNTNYLLFYLIPFILFLLLILIALVVFLVYRIFANYRAARKLALSRSQLRKLKKITFKKGQCNYETCAICIDDYVNGEKLRVLPCNHAYHCKCIDKWLLKRRRVCPICKHVIRFPGEVIDSDIEQEGSPSQAANNPSTAAATNSSTVLVHNEISEFPTVAIAHPRRKRTRRNSLPTNQPQASTSLDQQQHASTSVTDSDSESTAQTLEPPRSSFLDRLRRKFTKRSQVQNRVDDRAPLVHQSQNSSGNSTPPLTQHENLGFDQITGEQPAVMQQETEAVESLSHLEVD